MKEVLKYSKEQEAPIPEETLGGALKAAAGAGHKKIVGLVLRHCENKEVQIPVNDTNTALDAAATQKNPDMVNPKP